MIEKYSPTFQFLKSFNPKVDDEILTYYLSQYEQVKYAKKTIVTEEGKTQRDLFLVIKGIQKSYFLNDGKEHVMAFTYAPSFSGIPDSFYTQSPSKYYLETISDTVLLKLSYQRQMALLEEFRPIETLFRKATEAVLAGVIDRHHELMAFNIETRYRNFMKRSPHLLNQIPHKDIASYLRIDPSNFSKLLSKVKILV